MKGVGRYEVHEHTVLNSNLSPCPKVVHSHAGGDQPHQHPNCGPATYTIDKDEWFRKTGLRGGSRKKLTRFPSGAQLPWQALEEWQKSFEVIIAGDPTPEIGTGPGIALPMRIALQFKSKFRVIDGRKGAQ